LDWQLLLGKVSIHLAYSRWAEKGRGVCYKGQWVKANLISGKPHLPSHRENASTANVVDRQVESFEGAESDGGKILTDSDRSKFKKLRF
jgi:hypothetical protein